MVKSKKPLYIDPFAFQKDVLEWLERTEDGKYIVQQDLIIDLKYAPKSGCAGDSFVLSDSGQLLVMKGFRYNGPNVVPDAACKMLAALVHDALCTKEAKGQYSYWRKNKLYYDIMKAQGGGWFLSGCDFVGLLVGNWAA